VCVTGLRFTITRATTLRACNVLDYSSHEQLKAGSITGDLEKKKKKKAQTQADDGEMCTCRAGDGTCSFIFGVSSGINSMIPSL